MIFYPIMVGVVGLDHIRAGIFLGGTIHDVAQVIGAGFIISPETGDIATYVKLLRVTMLLPVVSLIAWRARQTQRAEIGKRHHAPLVPLFLIGFAVLVVINSTGYLPVIVVNSFTEISRWCLVTAIAALGMKTSFKSLIEVGWRPIALLMVETLWIGAFVLLAVMLLA